MYYNEKKVNESIFIIKLLKDNLSPIYTVAQHITKYLQYDCNIVTLEYYHYEND